MNGREKINGIVTPAGSSLLQIVLNENFMKEGFAQAFSVAEVPQETLKVLVLEDNPFDAELVLRALKKSNLNFTSRVANSKTQFEDALAEFEPNIILSDHSLGGFNSREALQICKQRRLTVPFILITGTVSEEFAVSILKEGADDYILKGNLARLPSAISAALKQKESEKKLVMSEKRLRNTLDNMMEGAQILGYDWRYIYVNDTVARQAKCAKSELLGKTMMEKYPGIENSEMFKALKWCMSERLSQTLENEFTYPDGSKGWFELSIQPVPEGLFVLSVDITEIKNAHKQLLKDELQRQYTQQLEVFKEESLQSLRYAQRLQSAVMQEKEELKEVFPESFILYMPKQIVSGDFFWFKTVDDRILLAAGDCTGHGIPGALLTIMGMNILHTAFNVHGISTPSELLKFLDEDLNHKLKHRSASNVIHDGMDITICEIDWKNGMLTVCGANNPIYLVRNGTVEHIRTDRYNIGNAEPGKEFEPKRIPIYKGDYLYMFSDGFIDQFGGQNGKKFGSVRFREILSTISKEKAADQEKTVKDAIVQWQGKEEQTDDILVMGIKIGEGERCQQLEQSLSAYL